MPDFIHRDIQELSAFRRRWFDGRLVVVVHQPAAALVATRGQYDDDVRQAIHDGLRLIRQEDVGAAEINFREYSGEDYRGIRDADRRLWPRGDGLITEIRRLRARGLIDGLAAVGLGGYGVRIWQSGTTPRANEVLSAAARADMWSGPHSVRWFRAEPAEGWPQPRPEPSLFAES